jgi:hypothetical protein
VRDIVRKSRADQYRLTALIMNVIQSVPFRQRAATGPAAIRETAVARKQ